MVPVSQAHSDWATHSALHRERKNTHGHQHSFAASLTHNIPVSYLGLVTLLSETELIVCLSQAVTVTAACVFT